MKSFGSILKVLFGVVVVTKLLSGSFGIELLLLLMYDVAISVILYTDGEGL